MNLKARLYIGTILAGGLGCFLNAMEGFSCKEPYHYICHLAIALFVSTLKVSLPGITGTISVSYIFVLLSMMDFSYPETVVVACLAIAVQSLAGTKTRPK